eukprot:CAMPEP_0113308384 /NCGR_PEP_ID=MMETSP0010_2-20120614/6841_1 /TAXON_ID=216773 ORGANISM="Corethron hystrix, Strain 308" /NCGR_SAMPLE_ID=MMETSP0010_2 /ASSEMBLY_ACC=CAM_ASM_000155 /LENGTH=191 /DNA_ID=CAMNT_0000163409 /DNA_START=55 /DNA_END=630 /DNA_ORIENTATION=+ /assembly_acc=CAM_ASM_000155
MRLDLSFLLSAALVASASAFGVIKAGDKISPSTLHSGFPPAFVNIAEYTAKKNVIVVGLPELSPPPDPSTQVPGYLEGQDNLKAAGIDEVIIYCVNDGAVMNAWAEDQGIEGSMLSFMGDPAGEFTKACGMEMTHPGPPSVGIIGRCKRWAMHVVDGVVKYVAISEAENDPAGDDNPEATLCPSVLKAISN